MQLITTPLGRLEVVTLHFDRIETPHAISTRRGGISLGPHRSTNIADSVGGSPAAVIANRKIICAAANLDGRRFACMEQTHGDSIATVPEHTSNLDKAIPVGGIDALICNRRDITLMAQSADCPLILLHDPVVSALAVVHSGWRSTRVNIAAKTVCRMQEAFGCLPGNIRAGISPCISRKYYEVGNEVSDQFLEAFPELPAETYRDDHGPGKFFLDLPTLIRWQLSKAGVNDIETADMCTYEREDLFYSHRRDNGVTGRFGLFAQLW